MWPFFFVAFFRVTYDGLSERGTVSEEGEREVTVRCVGRISIFDLFSAPIHES